MNATKTKPRRFEVIVVGSKPIAGSILLQLSKIACQMNQDKIHSFSLPLFEVESRDMIVVNITSELIPILIDRDLGMWFETMIIRDEKVEVIASFFLKHGASSSFDEVKCILPASDFFTNLEKQTETNQWN